MKTFKEQIKKDLSVFLNEIEFAETHDIDGESIPCVIDEDLFQERGSKNKEQQAQYGVFSKQISVFLRASSMSSRPLPEERISVDGEEYKVNDVIYANEMLELMLEKEDH